MAKDTKERILASALEMFATKGYLGTNMRELAEQLGLGKSALYKHYASKEDIWNSLLTSMEDYYALRFSASANLHAAPTTCDELLAMTMGMVNFTIHDERVIMVRKLLQVEQFHDPHACELATQHFLMNNWDLFTSIFEGMIEAGALKPCDPETLAFAYTTPISALIQQCDRTPEREVEIMEQIHAFITLFIETYGVKR